MLIINGRSGNTFKSMIRDLSIYYPDFLIASSEWYTVLKVKDYFEKPGDHADETESIDISPSENKIRKDFSFYILFPYK